MKSGFIFFGMALGLLFTSCTAVYYVPNSQNVPMIEEKGEIDASVAVDQRSYQIGMQGAYGVGKSTAIQVNAMVLNSPFYGGDGNSYTGGMIEAGVGYYKKFGNGFLFDTYLLGGYSEINNYLLNNSDGGELVVYYTRYSIQPSLSYVFSDHFTVSGSVRAGGLVYQGVHIDNYRFRTHTNQYFEDHNNTFFVMEPALTLRGGFEHYKLQLQYLRSFNMTDKNFSQVPYLLTLGFNIHF